VRLVALAAALLAVGLFALHQYRLVLPSTASWIGMALSVLVAFAIALVETAVPLAADRPVLGISAVGPWIVFSSLLFATGPVRDAGDRSGGGIDVGRSRTRSTCSVSVWR
jgi:hypothetical protein